MALPPAVSFTLTDAEAAALQNIRMRHQARIGGRSPVLVWGSIATPGDAAAFVVECNARAKDTDPPPE
ncbi:MAG: hypothetical protein AB7U38_13850 [Hyphomicrobiales bacterium]